MEKKGELAQNRFVPLLGILALACSLDDRQLELGGGGDAPTADGGSGQGTDLVTGENPNSEGGSGEGAQPLPPLVNGCADLDTDKVADCSVTLAKNPTFKSDVSDWQALATATLTWDERNALSDTPSGCALVTGTGVADIDGGTPFKASQCVAVPPSQIIIAYANATLTSAATAADKAQAQLEVSFFDGAGCSGESTAQFVTPPSSADSWTTIQAGGLSGPATTSASITLVMIKPYRTAELSACFDNVMLKAKPPSP